jgi:copper chaperone CopZ
MMDLNSMQFANSNNGSMHHNKKKTKKNNNSNTSVTNGDDVTSFHPPILFCGDCSACAAPPPAIGAASFSIDEDEESSPPHLLINDGGTSEFVRLRVYNGQEATGRMSVLKTILMDLDGVIDVHVSSSPSANTDSSLETIDSKSNPSSTSSRVVTIEYNPSFTTPTTAAAISTENPQEAKQDDADVDSTYHKIMSRLLEAGFDYAVLPKMDGGSISSIRTDSNHSLHIHSNLIPGSNVSTVPMKVESTILSCRTRLRVSGICCSSEVPAVRSILKPLPGVRKLGVNVATKIVYIDHDPYIISAELLAAALNEERFGAEIVNTDGASSLSSLMSNDDRRPTTDNTQTSSFERIMNLPRSNFVESTFLIPGMMTYNQDDKMETCPIGKVLRQNFFKDQLRAFHLHAQSQTLKVEHDPSLLTAERINNALVSGLKGEEWGRIELAHDGATEGLTLPVLSNEHREDNDGDESLEDGRRRLYCFRGLKVNIICSGLCWIISLLSYVGDSWSFLQYAGIGAVLFGLPPVALKAYLTVRRCQFDANCMMVTAALGALALGEYDEAASVSFLFAISEWLEVRATKKARRALGDIVSLRPDYANVIDPTSGGIVIVPVGCRVSVRTGDKVPADGVVVEGTSSVDESSLTGEARPVEKHPGEEVSGGSINVGSTQLVIRTTSTVGDSTLSRLIELVEEAQANTSETEKLVDAFAKKYTPFVLVIAFCLCTLPWFFGEEVGRYWSLNGLIFIIIACPCALTIR